MLFMAVNVKEIVIFAKKELEAKIEKSCSNEPRYISNKKAKLIPNEKPLRLEQTSEQLPANPSTGRLSDPGPGFSHPMQ